MLPMRVATPEGDMCRVRPDKRKDIPLTSHDECHRLQAVATSWLDSPPRVETHQRGALTQVRRERDIDWAYTPSARGGRPCAGSHGQRVLPEQLARGPRHSPGAIRLGYR